MSNLIPKSEGVVSQAHYDAVRAALVSFISPVLDGDVSAQDGIQMGTSALMQAVPAIREVPADARIKTAAAALVSIGAELGVDLVVIYPEEEADLASGDPS